MVWRLRQLLSGAFPLVFAPPAASADPGPAGRRRQRRGTGAGIARLRRMDLARRAGGAGKAPEEAASAPARLLQEEGVHGMNDDEDQGLLAGGEQHSSVDVAAGGDAKAALEERKRKQKEAIGKDDEEEALWMEIAKDKILEATSISDMFDTAQEYIDEEWLGDIDELPGNIYRIAALGTLTENLGKDGWLNLDTMMKIVRILGFVSIALVQLAGPPLLLAAVVVGWGTGEESCDDVGMFNRKRLDCYVAWGHWEFSMDDWHTFTTTKLLSSLFLFIFPTNGLYVLLLEKDSQYKIYQTFRYLKHNTPNMDVHGGGYLIIGALINSWVVCITCAASFMIIGASGTPRELFFDALGLLFLYNLDDLDSDLGFVALDDWDGVRLGWIFRHMVKANFQRDNGTTSEKFDPDKDDWTGWAINKSYEFVAVLLIIAALAMPIFSFFTPFSAIMPEDF